MDVRQIRMQYGLSQSALARALSCAPITVSRWEQGGQPTGIYRATLQAMSAAASQVSPERCKANGAVLETLGVGGFIRMRLNEIP